MNERLIDVTNSNLYLFNLLFRHQVYLEGVKAGFNVTFRRMLTQLYDEFAKYVGKTRYDKLDGFSRVELQQFVTRFKRAQLTAYNDYTQQLIELLKTFLAADVAVSQAIYKVTNDHPASQPLTPANSDAAPLGTSEGNNALWASVVNSIVPANGLTINQMLSNFASASIAKVSSRINMGYANGDSLKDAFAEIVGSSDVSYRDGLFSVFNNQNNAIIATALQHVSSMSQAAIASQFYESYQWVSVLDSKTTVICRSRNGNVYVYGKGPLPPAHWFCRSKAVALTQGVALHDIPNTFFDWAITQPGAFLVDALGTTMAARFLAGDNSVRDISVNDVATPLTINQFRDKINLITM